MYKREIDTRKNIKVITLNDFATAVGLENTSIKARKLLYLAIAQCRRSDNIFYEYSINASEFAELMGIDASVVYKSADNITDELMHGFLKYVPEGKKIFKKFQLFKMCEYTAEAEIKFQISEEMTPILLKLKENYMQQYLNDFIRMKSNYSIEIWHLMQREMHSRKPGISNIIEFNLTVEEIRQVTGTQNKLKQICEFKNRILNKALREIFDNCGVKITYSNIKKGRKVVGFHFVAVSPFHIDESKISQKTKDKIELFELQKKAKNGLLSEEEKINYNRLTLSIQN